MKEFCASSTNAKTIFTVFIQLPERGNEESHLGNNANNPNGSPNATPKPAIATVNCTAPPSSFNAPTKSVPRIGPVQENETIASVSAMKNMPPRLPRFDFESTLLVTPDGNPISNKPKNESANTKNIIAKKMVMQSLTKTCWQMSRSVNTTLFWVRSLTNSILYYAAM